MGANSPIEWTDATWNPIGGCEIHSPGCRLCYAMKLAGGRLKHHHVYAGTTSPSKKGPVFNGTLTKAAIGHATWSWPNRWRGATAPVLGAGMPSLIFVADMADLFHKDRAREDIDRVIAAIVYSRHIGQILTKRSAEMCDYFLELRESGRWFEFVHPILGKPNFAETANFDRLLDRLWLGVSVENQAQADIRIPHLLETPAHVRFLSCEPLLEAVDLRRIRWGRNGYPSIESADALRGITTIRHPVFGGGGVAPAKIDWVIAGGESGHDALPMLPDWARSLRDQCQTARVPFLFKQWGAWAPEDGAMHHVGKKAAGRLLDGRTHDEFPVVVE